MNVPRLSSVLVALFLTATVFPATGTEAQTRRPIPYPVIEGPRFEQAIANGTRSPDGKPGPNYWMNTATYSIDAVLSPATRMVRATETIRYTNNSPDELTVIIVHLRQNLHQAGVVRNRPQVLTEGMNVARFTLDGKEYVEQRSARSVGYSIDGTRMTIHPDSPVAPGQTVEMDFTWSFEVPEAGAPRIGTDGEMFFVGYWYPQVAMYDDVKGWTADPYMGNGEFYMGFADYDVKITAPEGWLVSATGELVNADDVLTAETVSRLERARTTDDIVHVVTAEERGSVTKSGQAGELTWHFKADRVRDFSFASSDKYVWDATHATVGSDNSVSMINAFYRPDREVWKRSAEFARYSIEFLSRQMDLPYPWPHMTTIEGVVGGGMEFPMMTHIGGARSDRGLFGVTFHEIGHMWFPMIVGENEKNFTWMDEGLTSFNTSEATADFWDVDAWSPRAQSYYRIAGTGDEVEPMRHGDRYPLDTPARGIASYNKPAVALNALRSMVGNDAFYRAYREYAHRWAFKHPQPYDLFNTFNDVLGQDLDWFWTTMFFETWTLDQAIGDVESGRQGVVVRIDDLGLSPFPSPVRVTYSDGRTVEKEVPVSVWLGGARTAELTFPAGSVSKVEIDPSLALPDVDRENNVWTK